MAGVEGVELAVYKNGVPSYIHSYGLRDRGLPDKFNGNNFWQIEQPDQVFHMPRGKFAPDAGTAFDLGSVSKEFTAGAILLLQQDGKLSVNDPLSKYFPTFPNGNTIKLLYMLQQRSGLVDYNQFGGSVDFTQAYADFMASHQRDYTPIVNRKAGDLPAPVHARNAILLQQHELLNARPRRGTSERTNAGRLSRAPDLQAAGHAGDASRVPLDPGHRSRARLRGRLRANAPLVAVELKVAGRPRRPNVDRGRYLAVGSGRARTRDIYKRVARADVHQEPDPPARRHLRGRLGHQYAR